MLPGDLGHLQLIAFASLDGDDSGSDGAEVAVVKDPQAQDLHRRAGGGGVDVRPAGDVDARLPGRRLGVVAGAAVLGERGDQPGCRCWSGPSRTPATRCSGTGQRRGIHDGSLQAANYEQLLAAVDGSTQAHECFVAVTVDARRAGSEIRQAGGGHPGAAAVRGAGGRQDRRRPASAPGSGCEGWCPPRLLGEIIRTAYDPASRPLIQRRGGADSDARGGDDGLPSGVDPADLRADAGGEQLVALPHRHAPCTGAGGSCNGPASTSTPGSCHRCCCRRSTGAPSRWCSSR